MLIVASLWWILFFTAVGLTVGSYLNVVIYRVPRGISTGDPLWSFCPGCGTRIRWYDNLPVASYLRLGARCRECGVSIPPRYPAVEMLAALLVLLLLDAFCVAGLRGGGGGIVHHGLTDQLSLDWPIVLAHLVLLSCLLAMSAIDLEHYFIDIRFTHFAVLAGVVLHMLWTPEEIEWRPTVAGSWHRPGVVVAAASVAGMAGIGLTWAILRVVVPRANDEDGAAPDPMASEGPSEPEPPGIRGESDAAPASAADRTAPGDVSFDVSTSGSGAASAGAWLVALTLAFLIGVLVVSLASESRGFLAPWRLVVPLGACFVLIVGAAAPVRAADTEIVEAIEAERHSARAVAGMELLLLLPAIIGAVVAAGLCRQNEGARAWAEDWLAWCPWGSWRPLTGLATAASGYVIGGALGWAVRIVFTVVLGREAFGVGDIHLMAAAGCVAGWPVVVMGFVLTSFLALLGWVVTLPFKRTRAIPLVPWLSLSFLIVVVFYGPLRALPPVQNAVALYQAVVSAKLTAGAH